MIYMCVLVYLVFVHSFGTCFIMLFDAGAVLWKVRRLFPLSRSHN